MTRTAPKPRRAIGMTTRAIRGSVVEGTAIVSRRRTTSGSPSGADVRMIRFGASGPYASRYNAIEESRPYRTVARGLATTTSGAARDIRGSAAKTGKGGVTVPLVIIGTAIEPVAAPVLALSESCAV